MDTKDQDKHAKALDRFGIAVDYWGEMYTRGQEDASFAYGNQWPDKMRTSREEGSQPCLTENRLLPYIHQVVNNIRKQRPKIRPIPVDSGADIRVADIMKGIIRNIESQSDAESTYDTAAKNAVESSIGWIRVNTQYSNDESFEQEIVYDRIINPFSVLIDPNHKRLDAADAEWAFVMDDISMDDFKDMYPDADTVGFDTDLSTRGWISDENIRVCEYYYKKYTSKTLVNTSEGLFYKDDMPEGLYILDERDVEIASIGYCKITGKEILEEQEVLGKYIPIVPVVGEEAFIDGKREFFSLIHQAKDPQFMLNVWKSASTEIIGLQPKAPFIGAVGSFETYADQWAQANVKNFPYLQYDIVTDDNGMTVAPPQKQMPITGSGSMMQESMASAEAIKATLGMNDAVMGENTNDVSGKAIIARQIKGDNATFHFVDNLSTAMKHVGRITVNLIPLIYSEKRILKIIDDDDEEKMIPINQPIMKGEKGDYLPLEAGAQQEKPIMLGEGTYDVDIEIGSDFDTSRQEEANAIIELARLNPEIMSVTGDMLVKALNIPHGQKIAERIKTTMDPALFGDDLEAKRLQGVMSENEQLKKSIQDLEGALSVKENTKQFDQKIKMEELQLDRERLQLDATKAMSDSSNRRIEVEAEAFKDYAQGQKDMGERMDDVSGAVEGILDHLERGTATGEPIINTPDTSGE